MALVKTTRRSHGPTIYTLELTEAEAFRVYDLLEGFDGSADDSIVLGLARALPIVEEIDAETSDVPDDAPEDKP